MADAVYKETKTIIFYTASANDNERSLTFLNDACRADERCEHRIFFKPLMTNVFMWFGGHYVKEDAQDKVAAGYHEIIYVPEPNKELIERLERTKNVVLKKNCMCFVGKDETKVKKLINWLLEETEEIEL